MRVNADSFRLPKQGNFVAFEGINGCGKTTLLRALSQRLQQASIAALETREPGGTPLGEELRKLLLEWSGEKKSDRTELLLFAASRAEHVDKVIVPALNRGSWVLCDRYLYSTVTFQGHGRGIRRDWIDQANALAVQTTLPDLVVLLDLEPREGLRRIASRQDNGKDSFEDEELAFHERIRHGFLECADTSQVPFLVLDGMLPPEELQRITFSVFG